MFPTASRETPKIKGAGFIEILRWYSNTQNPTHLSEIARRLPPRYKQYVTRPDDASLGLLPGTWYEAEMVASVFREMTADLTPTATRQLAEDAVRASVGNTLSGIYAGLIRMLVSPKLLADQYQRLWRLYHNTGEFKVHVLEPNKYDFRLSNWPVHDPFFCQMNFHATRLILELIGMKGVVGQQGGCVDRGAPYCSYIQTWRA